MYEEYEDPAQKSFFSEIISSISDARFSRDGRYILSRDYLTVKIWDVNMEKHPVRTINICDNLRSKLCDLYENDCIFDKFECTFSGDGKYALSGSYNNLFMIYPTDSIDDEQKIVLQADKAAFRAKKSANLSQNRKLRRPESPNFNSSGSLSSLDKLDYSKKILHASWHPQESTVAIAATNNVKPLFYHLLTGLAIHFFDTLMDLQAQQCRNLRCPRVIWTIFDVSHYLYGVMKHQNILQVSW